MRYLICLLFFLGLSSVSLAQGVDSADVADTARSLALADEEPDESEDGYRMSKSPTLALVYGIIPGGGQLYTEQYWKIPLFAVPIGALVGVGIYNHNLYSDYADQVRGLDPGSLEYTNARFLREQYRDRRDLSLAVAGGIFILSLIDAYSGAHLYDFDVDENLTSVYIFPDAERTGLGVGVRW